MIQHLLKVCQVYMITAVSRMNQCKFKCIKTNRMNKYYLKGIGTQQTLEILVLGQ